MKHSFECLIQLLKASIIILREIQSKSSLKFMVIRNSHIQTSLTVVFFLFSLHELLMNLRTIHEDEIIISFKISLNSF